MSRGRVWPAHVVTAIMLVYSVAKVQHALEGRLGIPGGPTVPQAVYDRAGNVAAQQLGLVAMGIAAACLAQATAAPLGRRVPHRLLVGAVAVAFVAVTSGTVAIVAALFEPEPLRRTQLPAAVLALVATAGWADLLRTTATERPRRGP